MLGQIRQGDDALDPPSGLRAAGQKPRKLDEDAAHLDCSHHGHACLFLRACGHPLSCAWPCWAAEWKENCRAGRSEEHTSELQSLMRISYAVFCLKKKNTKTSITDPQIVEKKSLTTHII